MNVTVNSQALAVELRLLAKVVPAKPVIPILSHVLLTAREGLHLYATDLEVGLSVTCAAQVDAPGTVALPVGKLLAMVEQFPDADVSISFDKGQALVKCGAFKSRMQALLAADFPPEATIEGIASTLNGPAFQQLIARTRYAVSMTASRRILQGALLTLTEGAAAMIATDGKRLALATAACTGAIEHVVIPAKAIDMLPAHEGDVMVTVGTKHLFFEVGGRLLTSRTFEGEFPAYERIIPRNNDKVVTIDRLALSAALRRVLIAAEDNGAVRIAIDANAMSLASASAEVGSADEVVAVGYGGPPLKICINGSYVLDFLNAATGDATLLLKDETSAALLTDGPDHLAVIMLMRG